VTPTGPGLTGCQVYGPNGTILTFKCHNLGADETSDPFTPSWKLIGNYYQWGRSQIAANAPVNNSIDGANQGTISGWNNTNAPDDCKDVQKQFVKCSEKYDRETCRDILGYNQCPVD
jgi:hypothetical protein